jgi:hypothetical protein
MVPVKKPGRPLSACPHISHELCGCSSITAAIPRNQKCGCGTSAGAPLAAVQPKPTTSPTADAPSPTKASFKIQKSSKQNSRRQSYDLNNLEKMDPNTINVIPFQSQKAPQMIAPAAANGYPVHVPLVSYANGLPTAPYPTPMRSLPPNGQDQHLFLPNLTGNGYPHPGLVVNPGYNPMVALPEGYAIVQQSSHIAHSLPGTNAQVIPNEQPHRGSCCSPKGPPAIPHQGSASSISSPVTPIENGLPQRFAFPNGNYGISQQMYAAYQPQSTTFSYPPSYGSFAQPLQPQQWRDSAQSNMYAQQAYQAAIPAGMSAFDTPPNSSIANLETLHTCSCGDTCQCIGCAAHPYNDATQEYVRSAWKLAHEPATPVASGFLSKGNGFASMDGEGAVPPHITGNNGAADNTSSPKGNTPSDSGTADEQVLPETDFFFVEYPFLGDGCGGDTHTCPCGDGCQCIGCTIHSFNQNLDTTAAGEVAETDARTNAGFGGSTVGHSDSVNGVNRAIGIGDTNSAKGSNGSNGSTVQPKLEPDVSNGTVPPKKSCCCP